MAYPASSAVTAGQPTASAHYNNLRLDALYLGSASGAAATLGTLLQRFETGLTIQYLATAKVRIPASATAPVCLVIDGVPVMVDANVDLDAGDVPVGVAAQYYIFAVDAGDGTFTVDVDVSDAEGAGERLIGGFYWNGTTIDASSIYTCNLTTLQANIAASNPQVCNGRLTLTTATPITTSDVASSGTVYFTPYEGNTVALYGTGLGWKIYSFTEISASLAGLASGKNQDVFIYDNVGTLTLELVEWTNDSTRATNLALQDGVYVQTSNPQKRYLGTIRTSGAAVCADTLLKRHVWNYYHRTPKAVVFRDTTDWWTYATVNTYRQANGAAANKVEFVLGVAEDLVDFKYSCGALHSARMAFAIVGVGLDSVTTNSAQVQQYYVPEDELSNFPRVSIFAEYRGQPAAGYHYLAGIEATDSATATFCGDYNKPLLNAGCTGLGSINS